MEGKTAFRQVMSLLKFEMSHAQLASFILSSGRHEGTPITFTRMPQSIDTVVRVPGINLPETKAELHQREVRESAARQVADLTRKNSGVRRQALLVSWASRMRATCNGHWPLQWATYH